MRATTETQDGSCVTIERTHRSAAGNIVNVLAMYTHGSIFYGKGRQKMVVKRLKSFYGLPRKDGMYNLTIILDAEYV